MVTKEVRAALDHLNSLTIDVQAAIVVALDSTGSWVRPEMTVPILNTIEALRPWVSEFLRINARARMDAERQMAAVSEDSAG